MLQLKAFSTLNDPNRNSAIDVFRGLAIILVVLSHFDKIIPLGNTGVGLFFVISGFLVGGLLTKEMQTNGSINYFRFFFQRAFKIWPSYYAFIFLGTLLAIWFFSESNPDQIIGSSDIKRYLFFYQNYTGEPYHWTFDHIWSICVEEHFYIVLPLMFLLVGTFSKQKNWQRTLFLITGCTILAGIGLKFISYYFTGSQDTYSGTHNRIDALAWGVLLNLIINYQLPFYRKKKYRQIALISGIVLITAVTCTSLLLRNKELDGLYLHSLEPMAFFLMLFGAYTVDFSRLKSLRIVAYYSYNWYLWHSIFALLMYNLLGKNFLSLLVYLLISFLFSILMTQLIEEPFLKLRRKLFRKEKEKPVQTFT